MDAPATTVFNNKARWFAVVTVMLSSGLALSACNSIGTSTLDVHETATKLPQPQPSELMATAMPTLTPNPTLTETPASPTLTPTLTPTSGASPTPAPTPVFGAGRVGVDFLFGNQPEGCELPCWQGLVVGKSDAGDIQTMFDTAFGFNGSKIFQFEHLEGDPDLPGFVATSYSWTFRETLNWRDGFLVVAWIHEDTRILEAIDLDSEGNEFKPYSSPQQILRGLGVPSRMRVSIQQSEDPRWGLLNLVTMYGDIGVTVHHAGAISITPDSQGNDVAKFCLGGLLDPHYIVDVYLTAPFPSTASELSPVQEYYIGSGAYSNDNLFQDVFGMSLEEVTKLAQEKDNACIYAPVP